MDAFLQDIVDCFNKKTPDHVTAEAVDHVVNELTKAFEKGNKNQPLKFD